MPTKAGTKAELQASQVELQDTKAELQGDKEGEPQDTKATKAKLQATIRLLQATKAELHKCISYRDFFRALYLLQLIKQSS